MLERMVEALGGWAVVDANPESLPPIRQAKLPELVRGAVLADRYELLEPLANASEGTFRAVDRTTRQPVLLRLLQGLAVDASLTQRFQVAVSVSHPNVCRVHDLVLTELGPAVIMEGLTGETLATRLVDLRRRGGLAVEVFRRIASEVFEGLAAIHARDATHGAIDARNVLITDRKAVLLDMGFSPDPPSVAGLPASLRALRAAEDVRAAAQLCWSMFCIAEPDEGASLREKPLRAQPVTMLPTRLASDELRQIFQASSPQADLRPRARDLRFVQPAGRTPNFARQEHRLAPGPPPGSARDAFVPGAQSLFVTFSATSPESVGQLLPLEARELVIGRSRSADLPVREQTVSSAHARLTWQKGQWLVEDLGSTNGTFTDDDYARQERALLRHGGEVQLGEMRVMLVGFHRESTDHARALRFCARRDALTGLLDAEALRVAMDEDERFAVWAELPMHVVRYRIRRGGPPTDRLAILEQLALRRIARRTAELTDNMLLSLTPVVAGRPKDTERGGTEPRGTFVISMVGPTAAQAQNVVDLVTSESRAHLPAGFVLEGSLRSRGG